MELVDAEGGLLGTLESPKFCGCGLSQGKPLCDGSHKKYVKIFADQLRSSRELIKECISFAPSAKKAHDIREDELKYRLAAGEQLVGLKVGGALDSASNPEPNSVMIFGYLTDAMAQKDTLSASAYIHPRAEAEVVFKIGKAITGAIELNEVLDYVTHVAAGMEIFDYRYGRAQIYAADAIADNAGAAAFAHSDWVKAEREVFNNLSAQVLADDVIIESAPLNAIRGNPWLALVLLSKLVADSGVAIAAGSIIFSGSATNGVLLEAGKNYQVNIEGLGKVDLKVS